MLDTHMLPDMPDIPMDTHIPTVSMERDLLMPSQLMPTTDTTDMPDLILMDGPHTDTLLMLTERDPLMLSQRLMLMLTSMDTHMLLDMLDMPMELTHMPMVSMLTERDLLMLSQRLMHTTPDSTDMPDLTPTDMPDTDMVVMDMSGDKLNATQLRSSKANNKYQ